MSDFVLVVLVIVAAVDLFLIFSKKPTISQVYQKLFPTWVDIVILITVMVGISYLLVGSMVKLLLGVTAGHLFWPNKERHK